MTRIPDIYLTPKKLEERSVQLSDEASHMTVGIARDAALKAAAHDKNMAVLMRYAGYSEDEGPTSKRIL